MFDKVFEKRNKHKAMRWYVSGPFWGLIFTAVLLYVCSMLLSREFIPTSLVRECAIMSVFLGSMAGGIIAAKRGGEGVLVKGALTGIIILSIILIIAILRPDGKVLSQDTLKTAICAISGGTCGGVMCLKRSGSKKHKKNTARSGI
jgi:putative membrane protein (TIGR04086 family)